MSSTNRRSFLKRGGASAAAAAAVAATAAVPAQAQDKPVKRVIRKGAKPAKTPLFNGTVAFGNIVFIAGVGAHFEGDIKAHP